MLLDLHDPASIAAWVRVWPARHWPQLKAMVALQPGWRGSARQAQELLRAGQMRPGKASNGEKSP